MVFCLFFSLKSSSDLIQHFMNKSVVIWKKIKLKM